jgi:hypothetical protein
LSSPEGVRVSRNERRRDSGRQRRLSRPNSGEGYEALKDPTMDSENSSDKMVSVAQNDTCNEWPSNASIDHDPIVSIEEDRVGSMNHLLG